MHGLLKGVAKLRQINVQSLGFIPTIADSAKSGGTYSQAQPARAVLRLEQLHRHPSMRDFLRNGGELYIATEYVTVDTFSLLYDAGHRHFAEKFVIPTSARFGPLMAQWKDLRLSCYGHLQTNKVRKALQLFHSIETISSESIALLVRQHLDVLGSASHVDQLLIQVNQGREPQKSGVWPENAQRLIDHCRDLALPIEGLMTIPPRGQDPLPYFRSLRALADSNGLHHCQMGMTDDWPQAVRCGATRVRIGRGIFGPKADDNGIVEG